MVEDVAFSHKIDYVTNLQEILNPEGQQNRTTGSKVTAILLNGWILPVGGVASGKVCAQPAKQACFYNNLHLTAHLPVHCTADYIPPQPRRDQEKRRRVRQYRRGGGQAARGEVEGRAGVGRAELQYSYSRASVVRLELRYFQLVA